MQQGDLSHERYVFAPCLDFGQVIAVRPENMVMDVIASIWVRKVGAFS